MGLPALSICSLTKINASISAHDIGGSSIRLVNPATAPGMLYCVGTTPARDRLGGQVASKLGLDRFVQKLIEQPTATMSPQLVLEECFREANDSVYEFGHRLAASGRMATSMVAAGVINGEVSVGRIGGGDAYLYRGYELFPFFEPPPTSSEWALGAASLVSVQLSSLELQEFDQLLFFSHFLPRERLPRLLDFLDDNDLEAPDVAVKMNREVFPLPGEQEFIAYVAIGPEAIILR